MTWCECVCGHHRGDHPWLAYNHGGCKLCMECGKPDSEHVFVSHQFHRCPCNLYRETA